MSQTGLRRRVKFEVSTPKSGSSRKVGEWFKLVGNSWIKTTNQNVTNTTTYTSVKATLDQLNPGPPYKTGGPFTSVESKILPVPIVGHGVYDSRDTFNNGDGAFRRRYAGGFSEPNFGGWDFTTSQIKDLNFLLGSSIVLPTDSFYSLVKPRLQPKINKGDLAQFLIELKDTPRMLSTTAFDFKAIWLGMTRISNRRNLLLPYMDDKHVADTFINHQFGWRPFVQDVINLLDAYVNSKTYLDDITSRNGKWEHRSGVIKKEEIDNEVILSKGSGMLIQPTASPLFLSTVNTESPNAISNEISLRDSIKVWASGEFTFYHPEFDISRQDFASNAMLIRRHLSAYGAMINPYVLWKVMPWSWLIDWFSSVGHFIKGINDEIFDNVASKNLFLMHSRVRRIVIRQNINFWIGARTFEFYREIRVKQRNRAVTPFGFGLKWEDLSPTQLAILTALGISRNQAAWR
jgi:hypothetical protein